eukprot:TRINITY_DN5891_c0_g3_i3.p1 TRINITY_DN5891_c0_g3~~TRINITY_DN5891_c0_g3_i3.p1  ORF type:complete len:207 (+),score=29.79 TRINITY_DN5891_c0_g3_i3:107-727(+)
MNVEVFFVAVAPQRKHTFVKDRLLIGIKEFCHDFHTGELPELPAASSPLKGTRKQQARRGTPGVPESTELRDMQASKTTGAGRQNENWKRNTNPGLQLTAPAIKLSSILQVIRHWNIAMSPRVCCPLHASLHEAENIIRALKKNRCIHQELYGLEMGDEQCGRCGMVNYADDTEDHGEEKCMWCYRCAEVDRGKAIVPSSVFFPRH